jgi:hypothetical protein
MRIRPRFSPEAGANKNTWLSPELGGVHQLQVCSGGLAFIGREVIGDLLAFIQAGQTSAFNSTDMYEYIAVTAFGLNEAVAFSGVEPFYGTVCHGKSPLGIYSSIGMNLKTRVVIHVWLHHAGIRVTLVQALGIDFAKDLMPASGKSPYQVNSKW